MFSAYIWWIMQAGELVGVFTVYFVDNAGRRDCWVFSVYILWIMQAGEIGGCFLRIFGG